MQTSEPLFRRLGGPEGIAAIVDDIVVAHSENPVIRARFLPIVGDAARLAVIKRHTCQFLEMGGGGPAAYEGRSMPDAHRGMNINAEEYLAAVDDILMVLTRRGLDEQTRNDVLVIAYGLKATILHQ